MSKGVGEAGRIPKELRPVAKKLRKAGWQVLAANSGHLVWIAPDGSKVHTAQTPKRRTGILPALRDLRAQAARHGVEL